MTSKVVQVNCGCYHTCIVLKDGSIDIFGSNKFGQLNYPNLGGRQVVYSACGYAYTCIILDDGSVRLFGDNE